MRKLLILPVFLLFAACPEKMIPDGGGTIKNFQVTETESEYRFTWDAVDLSEYLKQYPQAEKEAEAVVYTVYGFRNTGASIPDFADKNKESVSLSVTETAAVLKKTDVIPGDYCFIVRSSVGSKARWYYISRQIEVTVNPSEEMTDKPINNFRYEGTVSRYLFLWDPIDFTEYKKTASPDAAQKAEENLNYTVRIKNSVGETVFEKSGGRNTEMSVEKSALPSGTYTAEVFYGFFMTGDPTDADNVLFRATQSLTVDP